MRHFVYRQNTRAPQQGCNLAHAVSVLGLVAFGISRAAHAQISPPIDVQVPLTPSLVAGDGKRHLAYEVHVTNFGVADLRLRSLQVVDADRETTLLEYTGEELQGNIRRIGVAPNSGADLTLLPGGARTVVFLWVTLANDAPAPLELRHRLVIATVRDGDSTETTADSPSLPLAAPPVTIGPPLRGSDWLAANGPSNTSGHRRALIPVDGAARIAQRFAIDWVQVVDGSTNSGDPKDNSTYHAWGSEALAVADGAVASVKDGIPENVPGLNSRAVPITLETVGGNYVILDIGGGHFAFYAHLQPGTLRVAPGDHVRRGDVLGLVGNSGNSTEPHLHFHVANGNSPLGAEGIPYELDLFDVVARTREFGQPLVSQSADRRQREIPLANVVVRFVP